MKMYKLLRPFIFKLDPEKDHHLVSQALGFVHHFNGVQSIMRLFFRTNKKPITVAGLTFDHRIGVAAGFDKNATMYNGIAALGASFLEVGSVTLEPQSGNAKPRILRLVEDQAIINHMGLNNVGLKAAIKNLTTKKAKLKIGLNIAPNHDLTTPQMLEDMATCANSIKSEADFLVLNLSCPNQVGVQALQNPENLRSLLQKIKTSLPIFCKFSSDLEADSLIACITAIKPQIAGVVLANTSLQRPNLKASKNQQAFVGGLSGRPIYPLVLKQTKLIHQTFKDEIAIICSGGIFDGTQAETLINAGADLIELYSGIIYEGPGLIKTISKAIN